MNVIKATEIVQQILTELGIMEDLLYPEVLLQKDLQIDSVETVEISLALKRQLGITVKIEGSQDMTLSQLCDLVADAISNNSRISL